MPNHNRFNPVKSFLLDAAAAADDDDGDDDDDDGDDDDGDDDDALRPTYLSCLLDGSACQWICLMPSKRCTQLPTSNRRVFPSSDFIKLLDGSALYHSWRKPVEKPGERRRNNPWPLA
jgi:hypothetical protein